MRIGPPRTDAERIDAFQCLLGEDATADRPQARRAASLAAAGTISLDGLIAAWEAGVARCAALFCLAPDGTALVWPPEIRPGVSGAPVLGTLVLREIVSQIDLLGSPFAQSLTDPKRCDQRRALELAGFRWIAEVVSLQRPLTKLPAAPPRDLVTVSFSEVASPRFEALIERTYLGSQDRGSLAHCRTAGEALLTYRCHGTFTPQRWRLVEAGGTDVAVILVNDLPEEASREILYLGVVPEARRRGFGRALVAEAVLEAAAKGCVSLVTVADVANRPAISLYTDAGFVPRARKAAFARRKPQDRSHPDGDDNRHEQVVHTG